MKNKDVNSAGTLAFGASAAEAAEEPAWVGRW